MDENKIIYDWISFTSKIHTVSEIIEILGFENVLFESTYGMRGYSERLYYNGVNIHFNEFDTCGVWCELSGQGCRYFESQGNGNYSQIFSLVRQFNEHMNITRLDIALDIFDGNIGIKRICDDVRNKKFVSKMNYSEVTYSTNGLSALIGSKKSDILIRIYDKAAERKKVGISWIRIEMQLRDNRAYQFIASSAISDGEEPISIYKNVLLNYLRFVVPDLKDTNKSRWKTSRYWLRIIGDIEKIRIFTKPGIEYNILNTENYVYKQAGNAISTLEELYGKDKFFNKLHEEKPKTMPLKYRYALENEKFLINQHKNANLAAQQIDIYNSNRKE